MSDQFTVKDRERLVRVEEKVDDLCDDFKQFIKTAASDVGFPRCAARAVEWKNIHIHQQKVENFINWFYRGLVVLALTFLLSQGYSHSHAILKALTQVFGESP